MRVLDAHTVATARTIEQKISDAGPNPMRINPHVLTTVRASLMREGVITESRHSGAPWYHLVATPGAKIERRLAELVPIHRATQQRPFLLRLGQALEIAVYRALTEQPTFHTFGAFRELDAHDDAILYPKEEPPSSANGLTMSGRADFLLVTPDAGLAVVEVKNLREWLYPDRTEIRELLVKAVAINAVPVLIARRIPYVTFRLLNPCGVIIHQTYNQRFAHADAELADKARHKDMLGYHDILLGNLPDARLTKFVQHNLPVVLREARERFDENRDLLAAFASGDMEYTEFAARVRRRGDGTNEDYDWEDEDR
ncbi:hypothetical protein FE249_20935 (plasmid) [Acidiphilium multivorum]|nr:hypothetical protein FE249_20935 [Acidiphilium multivorum]